MMFVLSYSIGIVDEPYLYGSLMGRLLSHLRGDKKGKLTDQNGFDSEISYGLFGHQACTWYMHTDICADKILIDIKIIKSQNFN